MIKYSNENLTQLTHSEVIDRIRTYKATGAIEVRNEVVESYLVMAEKAASKMASKSRDGRDECLSEAVLALVEAIERFDVDRGTNFSSYAWRCMTGYILNKMNSRFNKNVSSSLDRGVGSHRTATSDGTTFLDRVVDTNGTAAENLSDYELRDDLMEAMMTLSDRDRQIVMMYFGIGVEDRMTYEEISAVVGMTKMGCCKVVKRALATLKSALSE